jgi:hypothetical protein
VGPRAGLDDVEKRKFLTIPGLELQPLGSPALSQSLYRLLSLLGIQGASYFGLNTQRLYSTFHAGNLQVVSSVSLYVYVA